MSVAEVLDLRQSGLGYRAIATQLGMDRNKVLYICHKNGMAGQRAEAPNVTEETVADYVSRSGFDYVGGYTMAKKPITVRCRDCGRTFERQAHIFRDVVNGTWTAGNECPLCRKDQTEQRKKQAEYDARIKAEQQAYEKAKAEAELISRQTEERLAIHICKNCGQEYSIGSTGYNSTKYCSEKCMKRWAMRVKRDRRHKKIMARVHDADITLEGLFKRDGGICYLCFQKCDWNDIDADGNACDNYPSIDHVKPIAKGGTHTWGNIKLACRKCNIAKRDLDYAPVR